jgi:hypothetical protein
MSNKRIPSTKKGLENDGFSRDIQSAKISPCDDEKPNASLEFVQQQYLLIK